MSNKNIVTYENAIDEIESYEMYYECPNCKTGCLIKGFKFCPECGIKLEWNLETKEELIQKIKEMIKAKGEGYTFNYYDREHIIKNNEIFEVNDNSVFLYNHSLIIDLYELLKCLK